MMPKFFVCSDIHSAYTPWMKALIEAGFDEDNPEHKIIVCGDLFDRMDETRLVYEFTKDMIEKDKLIYIKGNHELLMQQMLNRGFSLWHDMFNGTEKTYRHLTEAYPDKTVRELLDPLYDKMVNYLETKHFVFCHGFLPVVKKSDGTCKINYHWRRAAQKNWEDAMWINGMDMVHDGLYLKGKAIVMGHFHCSYGHSVYEGSGSEFDDDADFSPYYYEDKLIAIDSCVAHTGKVNVLVIEDEFIK